MKMMWNRYLKEVRISLILNLYRNCSRTRRKSESIVEIWETQDMETSKDNCEEWRWFEVRAVCNATDLACKSVVYGEQTQTNS